MNPSPDPTNINKLGTAKRFFGHAATEAIVFITCIWVFWGTEETMKTLIMYKL